MALNDSRNYLQIACSISIPAERAIEAKSIKNKKKDASYSLGMDYALRINKIKYNN